MTATRRLGPRGSAVGRVRPGLHANLAEPNSLALSVGSGQIDAAARQGDRIWLWRPRCSIPKVCGGFQYRSRGCRDVGHVKEHRARRGTPPATGRYAGLGTRTKASNASMASAAFGRHAGARRGTPSAPRSRPQTQPQTQPS